MSLFDMLSEALIGVKTLKVEPFLFLLLFGWSVSSIVTQQLIQDKICMNEYNQSADFCKTLSESSADSYDKRREDVKSAILSDLVRFNMKNSFVSFFGAEIFEHFFGLIN